MDESNSLQVFFNGGLVKQETTINDVKNAFMEGMVVLDFDMLWAMVSLHICKKIEENWRGLMNMEVKLMELRGYVQEKFSIALKINSLFLVDRDKTKDGMIQEQDETFSDTQSVDLALRMIEGDLPKTKEGMIQEGVCLLAMILHWLSFGCGQVPWLTNFAILSFCKFGTGSTWHGSDELKKSEELKRKARAERFGLSEQSVANDEFKKKAHAARFAPVSKMDTLEGDKKKATAISSAS
ncbi:hypothetical protein HHK36_006376 [Tetracentron sinense]|uniref:Uncharacterized protein n=1 Tax=Tetracentron sinense TaxID=13715 RepID=A0A834ZH52_TETSI|nr:hypothetical protein HHK36_006376 [Tetracentron sinense]